MSLDEVVLWVFTGNVVGVRLVEGEVLAVLLFHILGLIRFFSQIQEPGRYHQTSHSHEDPRRYDTCKAADTYLTRI